MPRFLLLPLCLFFTLTAFSQATAETERLYFVGFQDKLGTPYTVNEPASFLSERALDRRQRHAAAITELDLPISPDYETAVLQTGARIWLRSKWMNGVVVAATDTELGSIKALSFTDTTYYVAPLQYERSTDVPRPTRFDQPAPVVASVPVTESFYGYGWTILQRMNGDSLHRLGFRGKGVLVGVFDGGFPNVGYKDFLGYDQPDAVPGNYDLVEQDSTALDGSTHGATVLSTMAAHHPFFFIGTAPEARYLLFKTENSRGEHRLEEINYAIALEMADSAGVDLVNSSLGYTTFTDSSMNYGYADLDGTRSPASVAIDRAFDRGMIIVTSAGNSGADEWKHIGTPADARKAFSIGALDDLDERAYFSSFGPTADGRVKPDVSGPGVMVAAVAANGKGLTGANGTSLSAPLITGLIACLMEAMPEATNEQILEAVRMTASHATEPNAAIGYGKPDFTAAYRYLLRAEQ
ncbi:hypothetical protein GGR28_000457 [Lewinella aquimaris]|uniref:Peptidase S8/S53 domain-containing protein n=1 Tax=Neolewinella aquimaris TaxID=1835722 RepID=A0A840EA16_9BACT|nr:S8 family serine peptidase [Neolewinella aquimaris]MBB4077856.1 hypothetical protein [Neolewinella aquimaris]